MEGEDQCNSMFSRPPISERSYPADPTVHLRPIRYLTPPKSPAIRSLDPHDPLERTRTPSNTRSASPCAFLRAPCTPLHLLLPQTAPCCSPPPPRRHLLRRRLSSRPPSFLSSKSPHTATRCSRQTQTPHPLALRPSQPPHPPTPPLYSSRPKAKDNNPLTPAPPSSKRYPPCPQWKSTARKSPSKARK